MGRNLWSEYTEQGCPKEEPVATKNCLTGMNASGAERSFQGDLCDPQLFQPTPSAEQWILTV